MYPIRERRDKIKNPKGRHTEIGCERTRETTMTTQSRILHCLLTWLRENPVRDRKEGECDMSSEGFSNKDFFTDPEKKMVVRLCLASLNIKTIQPKYKTIM